MKLILRITSFGFILCFSLIALLFPVIQVTASEYNMRINEPITITATLQVGEELEDGYWLTGLSADDSGDFDVLALVWTESSIGGWFSAWGLQLVSKKGLIPARLATEGTGFLKGYDMHQLAGLSPKLGHVYTVTMSYDPDSGALAILLVDETDMMRTVMELGMQIGAMDDPIYTGKTGEKVGGFGNTIYSKVSTGFLPIGLESSFVQMNEYGTFTRVSLESVDRRAETYLRIYIPWNELPGELSLWLEHDGKKEMVGHMTSVESGSMLPLALTNRPPGEYRLSLDYSIGKYSMDFETHELKLGVVEAYVDSVAMKIRSSREVIVRGDLVVSADGWVPEATVSLNATMERKVLGPGPHGNQRVFTGDGKKGNTILVEDLFDIGPELIRIPFQAIIDVESSKERPYQSWNIGLEPKVESMASSAIQIHEESIRVLPDVLTLMTYNIQHGKGMDGQIDLHRIADVISLSDADIIGLQEVDKLKPRSDNEDQVRVLAEILGMHYAFGENLPAPGGGGYGNAVLSRYPILSTDNTRLPTTGGEPRGLMRATVDFNGTEVDFYVTHLSFVSDENKIQRAYVVDRISESPNPFILVGDFNYVGPGIGDPRNTFHPLVRDAWLEAMQLNERRGGPKPPMRIGYTFSSADPRTRIDYIFLSDETELVDGESVFVIDSLASDHFPLAANVKIKGEKQCCIPLASD